MSEIIPNVYRLPIVIIFVSQIRPKSLSPKTPAAWKCQSGVKKICVVSIASTEGATAILLMASTQLKEFRDAESGLGAI